MLHDNKAPAALSTSLGLLVGEPLPAADEARFMSSSRADATRLPRAGTSVAATVFEDRDLPGRGPRTPGACAGMRGRCGIGGWIMRRILVLVLPLLLSIPAAQAQNKTPSPSRLHDALGLPSWLHLSFEHRSRYETVDNQFRADGTGGDQVVAFRTLAFLEARHRAWRVGGEFMDSRLALDDRGTPVNTTQVDTAELLQAYLAWSQKAPSDARLGMEIIGGRQTIDLGNRRLVARNSFRNTINSFTGLDARLESPGRWQARGFLVLPVIRLPDTFNALASGETRFDEEDLESHFGGLFFRHDSLAMDAKGEVYFLYLHEDDDEDLETSDRQLYTPGFRIFRDPAKGRIDYELESIFQFGQSRATAAATDTMDLDHFAHQQHGQIGYTFDLPWSPRFLVQYDYASGDRDPDDDDNERFDTLFGARRWEYGPTGIWGAFARSNINTPGYRLFVRPADAVSAFIAHRLFWLASSTDAWTASGVRDRTGQSGTFIGHQLEASVQWSAIPRNLILEAGWAYLIKGEFAEDAPNAPADKGDSNYLYTQITFQF